MIEEYYKSIKREFKARCLIETSIHKVGEVYDVITFAKKNAFIIVEDERNYNHLTYDFVEFLEHFEIV
jgi:hypothetical protein